MSARISKELNRLELVAETLRATLNEITGVAPQWLSQLAQPDWYARYARRIEEMNLPRKDAEREAFVLSVAEDGYTLLDAVEQHAPAEVRDLDTVAVLKEIWERHFERLSNGKSRFKDTKELPKGGFCRTQEKSNAKVLDHDTGFLQILLHRVMR